MDTLLADLKYSFRSTLQDWRFALTVVLTLTVCIGANTALFTIVNSVLLQPLPVPGADSIVLMANKYPKAGIGDTNYSSGGDYYDRMRAVTALQDQAMFKPAAKTLTAKGNAEQFPGMLSTPSVFRLLGVAPVLGRTFTDAEGEIGADQKVILSYGLWQQLYAGDRSALGRELRLDGRPFTIVGVMPRGFLFVDPEVRYWIPLAFSSEEKQAHHSNSWYNVGRLKPGATLAQVQSQLDSLTADTLDQEPKLKQILINIGFHQKASPLKDLLVKDVRGTLFLLWAGAAFVLLIGAVNIANLTLARATARMKEFATRLALGARHAQIARQLMTESLVVALIGGAAGLALGIAILWLLESIGLDRFPRANEVHVNGFVAAFALAVSLFTGVFIALAPLAGIFKTNLTTALRETSRTGTSGRRSRMARQTLVVAQIAFAFVLLAGAGLLLSSFRRLLAVDPGFRTRELSTASTWIPESKYTGDFELRNLMNQSLTAIRGIPGVRAAGASSEVPLSGDYSDGVIVAEGYQMKPGESIISPLHFIVTPGYMQAMGMTLVHGRYFDERDNENAPRVAIIEERLANRFWPGKDPIGRRMHRPTSEDIMRVDEHTQWIKVVGVIRDTRVQDLAGGGNLAGAYYFPYAQEPRRKYTFAVSGPSPAAIAPALRTVMARVDPTLALFDVKTMEERKELSLSSRRTAMSLALAFGGLALFLSAVGIYSVLSYLLGQRRREIGIRVAVGSSPAGIFRLVLREGVWLIGFGLAIGCTGSVAMRRAIETQVYGVRALDPFVIGAVMAVLGGVALAACLRPAQQATKVDPVVVLNEQ